MQRERERGEQGLNKGSSAKWTLSLNPDSARLGFCLQLPQDQNLPLHLANVLVPTQICTGVRGRCALPPPAFPEGVGQCVYVCGGGGCVCTEPQRHCESLGVPVSAGARLGSIVSGDSRTWSENAARMAGACGGIYAGPRACGSSPLRGLWVDAYLCDWTMWVVRRSL